MVLARTTGLLVLLLALPGAQAVRRGAKQPATPGTTPVKKVVELLKRLSTKVEEDGKKEAAQYDKFACFCKDEADKKIYNIEKSESILAALSAETSQLQGDLSDLSTGIGDLATHISGLEGEIANKTSAREAEHEVYRGHEADTSSAISALERAIAAMKGSKGEMAGKVAFEKATTLLEKLSKSAAKAVKGSQPGEAYQYEYHANDIIATLESLLLTFKETKNRLDQEEFEANAAFEKTKLGLSNEKTFAEKEKLEKEKLEAMKTERLQEAQQETLAETGAKDADQAFMQTLTTQCEEKATEWDTRSQTRAGEIQAISKAMEALETGVAPNWKANRMLVGLQKRQAAPSFVQLRGSDRGAQQRRKALAFLRESAGRLHSPVLSVAALRVQASEDHFEKVRAIIKDIVARLEAQASAEATTKGFCDTEMSNAVSSRDAKQEDVERLTAQITEKTAQKAQLMQEIAALSKAIADNTKAIEEATELRSEEHQDNTNVMTDASEGKEAVEYALQVLKQFYEGAFLQQSSGYVPPNSDRSGSTVGDLAPEVFDNGYSGRQEDSKGIIGMLEVILSDFDRTGTTVETQDGMQETDFTNFKGAIELDTQAKEGDKETKEGQVTTLEGDLITLEDQKRTAVSDHELALSELQGLRSMCVQGEETYEERVAKREKEIAALKEAHAILENWQA
mmetsp:Transcript_88206/g.257825  ORF Transcript_88206/g.257825 Transcript_88206/m.257825 type:complete len:683 (-) Transcript_88206:76-2124(-)